MTREDAKELIPIIQAYAEGKTIQYRVSPSFPRPNNHDISYVKEWFDIDEDKCDGFSCDGTIDYRIKPELKYRPFNTQEECWNEMMKHQPFGWVKSTLSDNFYPIESISDEINYNRTFASYSEAFNWCKFADGTPFGIKEE